MLGGFLSLFLIGKLSLKIDTFSVGYSLQFTSLPVQNSVREARLNATEADALDRELQNFLNKGVVEKDLHSDGEFISTVFLRPKKNGNYSYFKSKTIK
jgi:hypothetical protein